jgi:hypothetical protein
MWPAGKAVVELAENCRLEELLMLWRRCAPNVIRNVRSTNEQAKSAFIQPLQPVQISQHPSAIVKPAGGALERSDLSRARLAEIAPIL